MATCLIALGGNLGDRTANLNAALQSIAETRGIQDVVASEFLETKPVGGPAGQPGFLNAAARLSCRLSPLELARRLHEIETQLGRAREIRWDARTIDLDLLLYDDFVCRTEELELPHPRMTVRQFVMGPAAEIAAEMLHPETSWSMAEHLKHLRESPRHLVLAGGLDSQREIIAEDVATRLDGMLTATHDPQQSCWQITPHWNSRKSNEIPSATSRPRIIAVLAEASAQQESPDESAPSVGIMSEDVANALVRSPGGCILRLSSGVSQEQLVAELIAAVQASEEGST